MHCGFWCIGQVAACALGGLESCTAKEVICLYSSRLVTGDQDLGCMGVGPCG